MYVYIDRVVAIRPLCVTIQMILLPVLFYVCELALSKDKSANDICIYDRGRYMTIYIKNLYTYCSVHNELT